MLPPSFWEAHLCYSIQTGSALVTHKATSLISRVTKYEPSQWSSFCIIFYYAWEESTAPAQGLRTLAVMSGFLRQFLSIGFSFRRGFLCANICAHTMRGKGIFFKKYVQFVHMAYITTVHNGNVAEPNTDQYAEWIWIQLGSWIRIQEGQILPLKTGSVKLRSLHFLKTCKFSL
jgi:hypothetical protein